ncbi:MAG: glycosyltransferase family 4 protein [Candidatus Omnitrophica bacterium]|nr:glycosyltransferase family 4 protein [Candidatus Omnitrophota bacterium]
MKVIFVTREGYNLPGARIRGYGFAKELVRRGVDAEVLSYADNLGAKDGKQEGSMGLLEKIKHNIEAYKKLSKEKNAIIILQRVNYHSFGPLFSRIIRRNRLVLDMDDWEIREDPGYMLGFYPTSKAEYLTRKIASLSDFCIAGSQYLADYLSKFNRKIYYIPSCVDAYLFRPNGQLKDSNTTKFIWTGTFHRKDDVENVKFIIDCFEEAKKEIKDICMDIVGDGIYGKEISRYILNSESKDSINFIGWIHPDKVPAYLERADIGLFPLTQSTRFNNAKSPTKLFEYMAMGKAVVSSNIGEAANIIEDGKDGFLAGDRKTFVGKMEILIKDERLRKEIGANARRKIEQRYSMEIAGDRFFSVLSNAYDIR